MKKLVFYPIIFSINPILLLYQVNISNMAYSQLSPIIFIAPLAVLLLLIGLNRILHNSHRAGFVLFTVSMWFFYYVPIRELVRRIHIGQFTITSDWVILPIWTVIFAFLVSNWLWSRVTKPEIITLYLNIVSIVAVFFSISQIATNLIPMYLSKPPAGSGNQSSLPVNHKGNLPDIYYIIMDGYAREDVLRDLYNYDNSDLISALKDRGFYIAGQSQSNYIQTAISLASSLNMQYLSGNEGTRPNKGLVMGDIYQSKSREILEQLGYKYVAFSTGYPPTDLTDADIYFSDPQVEPSHDLEALVMLNSTLGPFVDLNWIQPPVTKYSAEQQRIESTFSNLNNVVPGIEGPKFVFAYIFGPHPPSIFDESGPITPDARFVMEGISSYQGTSVQYMDGYVHEIAYLNQRLIETIDNIIANSKTPSVIIIQADHGPDAFLDWKSLSNSCLKERFSILNAYYFPNQSTDQLSETINPINTFAVVFNTYFGMNINFQENHQYFATWENRFPYSDVTIISQTCNRK